jgi:GT2 family glycosyltransferase
LIVSAENVGYAAAINAGRAACDGEVIVVTNPDVRFAPSAVDRLCDVDANVAGPALFWDDAHEWLLPPADLHTTGDRIAHALASRSTMLRRARDRARLRQRIAFWSTTRPSRVRSISGAVMAIRVAAFDRSGGFDERFRLYFEETDFLRRVGGGIVYVPDAKCRHIYNQSAGGSADAAALYAQSELAYLRKWSGRTAARLIKAAERPAAVGDVGASFGGAIAVARDGCVVEASPLPDFETAAGRFSDAGAVELPAEVLAAWLGGTLYLRVADRRSGEVLTTSARIRMQS